MTKDERIAKAYGNKYESLKQHIDSNGWINEYNTYHSEFESLEFDYKTNSMRPLELKGIEDNNGWVTIKSGNCINLPEYKKGDLYEIYNMKINSSYPCRFNAKDVKELFEKQNITHYRFVESIKKPLYL